MPDGREVMVDVVKAALDIPITAKDGESSRKRAAIIVEALIAESGGYDHIMRVKDWDFTIQHPIAERFEGRLFNCPLFHQIRDYIIGHEPEDGEYDVREQGPNGLVVTRRG